MKKLLFLCLILLNTSVFAKTSAGTIISNQASLMFDQDGDMITLNSNIAAFRVSELLDFTVTWNDATSVQVNSPDNNRALTYRITNTGNAPQEYIIEENPNIGGGDFNPIRNTVVIYTENGNQSGLQLAGANKDNEYIAGQTITLLPDQSIFVYSVYNIPPDLDNNNRGFSQLRVQSTKPGILGLTAPGQSLPASGGNPEVVVGNSLGRVQTLSSFQIVGVIVSTTKEMIESKDLNNGNVIAVNSELTYRIRVNIEGLGVAKSLRVVDILPPELLYIPNTLTLNGAILTDGIDADFGNVTNNTIELLLGDQVSPNNFEIIFKARII